MNRPGLLSLQTAEEYVFDNQIRGHQSQLHPAVSPVAFHMNFDGQPLTFVQGAKQIITGLEKAMTGMKVGESKNVTVQPEDGYGPVIEEAILEIDKDQLPPEAWQIGAHVQGQGPEWQVVRGQVKQLREDKATIDFNHPLAGKTLFFEVKVLDIQ